MLRGIHKLCDKSNWDETRQLLKEKYARESASRPGGWGEWTPLHLACKRIPPVDVIEGLIEAAPSSLETPDVYNRLPLHYAVEKGLPLDVLKVLTESSPATLSAQDAEGRTALCLSIFTASKDADQSTRRLEPPTVEEVGLLLDDDGVAAATFDSVGNLPLHYACKNIEDYPEDVVIILAESSTASLIEGNDEGLIPLHLILSKENYFPSTTLFKALLDNDGVVARTLDNNGNLPIHYVCDNIDNFDYETLKRLVRGCPETCLEKNSDGKTPLHQLLGKKQGLPLDVSILKLITGVDSITRVMDEDGQLPLHTACANVMSRDVICEVLSSYPKAAVITNKDGCYALELLENGKHCLSESEYNKISDLVFAYNPDVSPFQTDTERLGRFGMQICREITESGSLEETSLKIWSWMCTFPQANDPENLFFSIVENITRCISFNAARTLAELKTEDRIPIYKKSSPKISRLLRTFIRFADKYELDVSSAEKQKSSLTLRAKYFAFEDSTVGLDVLMKFLIDKDVFVNETICYANIDDTKIERFPVLPLLDVFDTDRVDTPSETTADKAYVRDMSAHTELGLNAYPYAYVRPVCVENFDDLVKGEMTTSLALKKHCAEIGKTLISLHQNGLCCGEIDTSNITMFESKPVFVDTTSLSLVGKSYYGASFHSAVVPPEMITKVDEEGLHKYNSYWKAVIDDATVVKSLLRDDVHIITETVNSFLSEDEMKNGISFGNLWDRMLDNAKLWKKITPRTINGDCFVVKCYAENDHTGRISCLPYSLCPLKESTDVWMFGHFIYEMCSGEPLFPVNKSGNLVNPDDIAKIYEWDNGTDFAIMKYSSIDDPLARDLLRELFVKDSERPNLSDVLDHPFFYEWDAKDNALRQIAYDIVSREEQTVRAKKEKEQRAELEAQLRKEEEEKLSGRTKEMTFITKDLETKMATSSWVQWSSLCGRGVESTHPSSFIALPYQLSSLDGKPVAHSDDATMACKMGLSLLNVLHTVSFTNALIQCPSDSSDPSKLKQYSDMNRAELAYAETNVVDICQGIKTRAGNAVQILTELLSNSLGNHAATVARKLVHDELVKHVDLKVCEETVMKAKSTGSAFAEIVSGIFHDVEKLSKQIVNEKYEALLGSEFCSDCISNKINVERVLFGLVKDFVEDPVMAAKTILRFKIEELYATMTTSKHTYIYLLDEVTGYPVLSHNYPISVDVSQKVLSKLLPAMRIAVRSACSADAILGVASLVGLRVENIPINWEDAAEIQLGHLDDKETSLGEYVLFEEVLNEIPYLQNKRDNNSQLVPLHHLTKFLRKYDSDMDYAGMVKIRRSSTSSLWVSPITFSALEESFIRSVTNESDPHNEELDVLRTNWEKARNVHDTNRCNQLKIWRLESDESYETVPQDILPCDSFADSSVSTLCDDDLPSLVTTKLPVKSYETFVSQNGLHHAFFSALENTKDKKNLSEHHGRGAKPSSADKPFEAPPALRVSSTLSKMPRMKTEMRELPKRVLDDKNNKYHSLTVHSELPTKSAPSKYMQKLLSTNLSPKRANHVMMLSSPSPIRKRVHPARSSSAESLESDVLLSPISTDIGVTIRSELSSAINKLRARRAAPIRKLCGSLEDHEKLIAENLDSIDILDSPTGSRKETVAFMDDSKFCGYGGSYINDENQDTNISASLNATGGSSTLTTLTTSKHLNGIRNYHSDSVRFMNEV